jgi:hypothetical protein
MDEHVLESRLDLMPPQCVVAKIGDCSLERRTIAPGDMDRSPEDRGSLDAGHLPQTAGGLVDRLSGRFVGN